ncbi:MAG: DUF502 domain-containing protein [Nitrospinaceae bacterium]|jgi:uncharacterized membrane protein|nr:MAG: DUF502 domain-containing protein [Nitrospinaceae bacterium]
MLRFFSKSIIAGLVTLLPAVLSLYLTYWMAVTAESALGGLIRGVLPENLYWPGMGLLAGIVVVFTVGLLMSTYVMQRVFAKGEKLLYHMPIIKSVYRATRDFFVYFSPTGQKGFEQVVAVTVGGTQMQVVGFVTQAVPKHLPSGFQENDHVLVYLPLSYMIGGYAVLVPRSLVRPIDMSMEEAMRFTLTAGVTGAEHPEIQKSRT